jgi:Family of unknown function (DUF5825)
MTAASITPARFAEFTGDGLACAGVRHVDVPEPVTLSRRNPVGTLAFVRLLREAAGHAMKVRWHGLVDLDAHARTLLGHLPPPEGDTAWSAGYRHGLCHYRRGPDFLLVTDRRFGEPATTLLLAGVEQAAFERYATVTAAAPGDEVFGRFVASGLLLALDGYALALPYRLRRWPIPCTAV